MSTADEVIPEQLQVRTVRTGKVELNISAWRPVLSTRDPWKDAWPMKSDLLLLPPRCPVCGMRNCVIH